MFWAALVLGLIGSLHCLGMCGPLVAAISITDASRGKTVQNASIYHGMRILAYGVLGLLPGILGEGLKISGWQKDVSLWMGLAFILLFIWTVLSKSSFHLGSVAAINHSVQNLMRPLLQREGHTRLMALGFLNGFIPCGMTYMAMASALAAPSLWESVVFMMVFGLGTTPALFSIHLFGMFKKNLSFLVPIGYLVIGLVLIYRGLFIDVPLDLRALKNMGWEVMCH